ncbi:uracil DNA N-glycosylase Thp1 [Coemansia sp. RSA 1933]|nr:uracil DNA N-glycosylase Thp1 [Coemansia sp. RSA 1933]
MSTKKHKNPGNTDGGGTRPKRQRPSPEDIASFQPIPEVLQPNLDILFVGINPGVVSGQRQLHFGNPQNYFWKGLYHSGLIPEEIRPEDGHLIHQKWNMSIVNLVQRTTPSASDLTRKEMRDAVPALCCKISTACPKIVCFVGKGIYGAFINRSTGYELGLQPEVYDLTTHLDHKVFQHPPLRLQQQQQQIQCDAPPGSPSFAYLFVMPSTSGRAAAYRNSDKLQYFRQLEYIRCCSKSAAADHTAPQIDYNYLDSLLPQKRQVKTSKYFSKTIE